jgi:hypothetical protein
VVFPYDVGWRKNVSSVMGPVMLCWLWPRKQHGTGMEFAICKDGDEGTESAFYAALDMARHHDDV